MTLPKGDDASARPGPSKRDHARHLTNKQTPSTGSKTFQWPGPLCCTHHVPIRGGYRCNCNDWWESVEMGGIEPPSNSRPRILLRAQSTVLYLSPQHCVDSPLDRLSWLSVGGTPPTWATPSGSLDDARHRAGSNSRADGLKVQAAISGSENVVGAILFGTYWFARIVNELSVHSRLASLRSTTTVETDHPLLSFQPTDARVAADRRTHQFTPGRTARQGKARPSEKSMDPDTRPSPRPGPKLYTAPTTEGSE